MGSIDKLPSIDANRGSISDLRPAFVYIEYQLLRTGINFCYNNPPGGGVYDHSRNCFIF